MVSESHSTDVLINPSDVLVIARNLLGTISYGRHKFENIQEKVKKRKMWKSLGKQRPTVFGFMVNEIFVLRNLSVKWNLAQNLLKNEGLAKY